MAPTGLPSPLTPWAKWAIWFGAEPSSYLVQLLDHLGSAPTAADPTPGEWRHIQAVFLNNNTGDTADSAVVTFDVVNITNGSIDSSWTDADYTITDQHYGNIIGGWASSMSPYMTAHELRYYARTYNPLSNSQPFPPSGPPVHVKNITQVGAGTLSIPPQVAMTVTERTTYPKHWGRFYLPAPTATSVMLGADGQAPAAFVDNLMSLVLSEYQALQQAEFFPCVPTTTVQKAPSRNLLGVTSVQVDSIYDVVRRRRPRAAKYKNSQPI